MKAMGFPDGLESSRSFASIDPIIRSWVDIHSLKLFNSFAGREERFCYLSNPRGECFQISIQVPQDQDGEVTIEAWTVETPDDRELHRRWTTPVSELQEVLELALDQVQHWLGIR